MRYNTDELHYIDEQWTHSIVNRHSYSNESALYMLDGGYTLAIGKYWALEGLLSMGQVYAITRLMVSITTAKSTI